MVLDLDFQYQESRVDNTILRLKERGETFLDDSLRLSNIGMLIRGDHLRDEFELRVIQDTTNQIDSLVSDIIDWMVEKHSKEWHRIVDKLKSRARAGYGSTIQSDEFVISRKELLISIGENIHQAALSYDKKRESAQLSKKVHQSMFQALAIAGASALGVGALLSVSLLDITGILGASALAATGLCIIPYRRVTVKKEFNKKISEFREKILTTLNSHFEHEVHNNCVKIRDAVSPFSTFVQKEQKRNARASAELEEFSKRIKEIQNQVNKSQ